MSARAEKKEKARNLEQLNRRFTNRITVVKHGKVAYENGEFLAAIKHYNTYLKIIADVKQIEEKRINPGLFDPDQELSEMLLISHIYWDLAKIYDRTPNLNKEFHRCLGQFVTFTTGHPYQVVNSEMIRRHIRSGKLINKKDFQEAYQKIYVNSKKCYVATHCFGFESDTTNTIRTLKPLLLKTYLGKLFVEKYYQYSPSLVGYLQGHPIADLFFTKLFARPLIKGVSIIAQFFKNHS